MHLAKNQGKAMAMNTGALLARHELLVCIDGDALLDPQSLRWTARVFGRPDVGAMAPPAAAVASPSGSGRRLSAYWRCSHSDEAGHAWRAD